MYTNCLISWFLHTWLMKSLTITVPWSIHVFVKPSAPKDEGPKVRSWFVYLLTPMCGWNEGWNYLSNCLTFLNGSIVLFKAFVIAGLWIHSYAMLICSHCGMWCWKLVNMEMPLLQLIFRSAVLSLSGDSNALLLQDSSDVLHCRPGYFNDCHKSTMKKLIWLTVEANDHH